MGKYDAFELDIKEGQIANLDKLNNKKKKLIEKYKKDGIIWYLECFEMLEY